jgi:NAD(P)-dependent dehydrogenase (short-subunit alcohol dehydrogenase family)
MKTVVVAGANAGIGFATAKYIASHPDWHVVLACRNETKAANALANIRQAYPNASVSTLPLDLFSLDSIRNFGALLAKQDLPPLHGLILNAGGINMKAKSLEFSKDGFEYVFQLNFLGHFALAGILIKQMQAAARIVFVSSDLHDPAATKMGKFAPPKYGPVEDVAYGRGIYTKMNPMARYGTAKMFAMMCAREFDRRLKAAGEQGITVNSWSPGVVPTTQAGNSMPKLQKKIMMSAAFVKFMGSHLSTEDEAASALGGLIIEPKFEGVSGRYFDGTKEIPSSIESRDETKARTVWGQAIKLASITREELSLA